MEAKARKIVDGSTVKKDSDYNSSDENDDEGLQLPIDNRARSLNVNKKDDRFKFQRCDQGNNGLKSYHFKKEEGQVKREKGSFRREEGNFMKKERKKRTEVQIGLLDRTVKNKEGV